MPTELQDLLDVIDEYESPEDAEEVIDAARDFFFVDKEFSDLAWQRAQTRAPHLFKRDAGVVYIAVNGETSLKVRPE
jgi:hypothetical protein